MSKVNKANVNNETETKSRAIKASDIAVGQSVTGYVSGLFKASKSLTPDVENIAIVTKDGEKLTIWSAGTLKYFRERMEDKNAPMGVLCRISRIERPASTKPTSKQKYFFDIGFKLDDVNESVVQGNKSYTDSEGFEF